MDFGYREVVLRPRAGQVLAALTVAGCAVAAVGLVARGDASLLMHALPALALLALGAVAGFWAPSVRIGPADLEFVNPLRTVRIAWPAVQDVDARWHLTVRTAEGRYTAWAAPRESGLGAGRSRRSFDVPRGAATTRTQQGGGRAGGVAGRIAVRQWQEYRDRDLLGAVEGQGVQVRWHVGRAVALALLTVATLASALVP